MTETREAVWQAFEAEDGYPTDEWLEHFGQRAYCPGKAARFLVNELPSIAGQIACMSVDVSDIPMDDLYAPGKLVHYVTGGWSGAEELIGTMLEHFWIAHYHSKWERGGAYWFKVPNRMLTMADQPSAAMQPMRHRRDAALPLPPAPR